MKNKKEIKSWAKKEKKLQSTGEENETDGNATPVVVATTNPFQILRCIEQLMGRETAVGTRPASVQVHIYKF